jgi:hypothetical protein
MIAIIHIIAIIATMLEPIHTTMIAEIINILIKTTAKRLVLRQEWLLTSV